MANHALVTVPLFFIVAAAAARAGGSEKLADMGGIAFRAPVLATLALVATFATLAIPGSSNFVGEFQILLGVFNTKLPIAILASTGVIGAAAYALRLFIRSMHNRVGEKVTSFEVTGREAIAIVPILLVVLVFAFYPQFGLERSQNAVAHTEAATAQLTGRSHLTGIADVAIRPRRIYTYSRSPSR
jgi:NADH-quinone oxidoreductase subunit M